MDAVRSTLGRYLSEANPLQALWPHLVNSVYCGHARLPYPERLTRPARFIFFVSCFRGEIINGGFSQFFSNSAGDNAAETLKALHAINADFSADLLQQACIAFGGDLPPADRNHRCEMLFSYEDENRCCFNDLDKQFYDRVVNATLSQGENLDELLMQFLRINSNVLVIDENYIG